MKRHQDHMPDEERVQMRDRSRDPEASRHSRSPRISRRGLLAGAGIRTVLCNVRTPRMNAITERWIGGCRRELLDRTLVWNQAHLRRILRSYETCHNQHRPHRSLHGAAPLKPLPEPVDLDQYRSENALASVA